MSQSLTAETQSKLTLFQLQLTYISKIVFRFEKMVLVNIFTHSKNFALCKKKQPCLACNFELGLFASQIVERPLKRIKKFCKWASKQETSVNM